MGDALAHTSITTVARNQRVIAPSTLTRSPQSSHPEPTLSFSFSTTVALATSLAADPSGWPTAMLVSTELPVESSRRSGR